MSATKRHQYPAEGLPEIALVGRSNVGKSSCVNALLNRRNFARTSQTPGKTRTINFYLINNEFYFVDLPGYGYAKVAKSEKDKWGNIMETFTYIRITTCYFLSIFFDFIYIPKFSEVQDFINCTRYFRIYSVWCCGIYHNNI